MSLRLLEPARQELGEAVAWYAAQAPGLGDAFLLETLRTFDLIQRHPDAWHPLSEQTRRCRLCDLRVRRRRSAGVGIAHLHRKPHDWRLRIKGRNP